MKHSKKSKWNNPAGHFETDGAWQFVRDSSSLNPIQSADDFFVLPFHHSVYNNLSLSQRARINLYPP